MTIVESVVLPAVGIALLGVNFFFVLAEFALVRLRASRVAELHEAGDPRAEMVQKIQANLDEYLSVVQVGITGATLGIGLIIEDGIAGPIQKLIGASTPLMGFLSHALGFFVATFLVIVTSELLPKSLAIRYAEPAALFCARPMLWCHRVFFPLLWLLTRSAQLLLRVMRLTKATEEEPHSEDELRIILDRSQSRGLLSFRRLLFLENVFDLGELRVKDAMRSRGAVRFLNLGLHWSDHVQFMRTWRFSRYPLFGDDPEKPLGIIHVKDLLFAMDGEADPDLPALARPYLSTTGTVPLEQLLSEMQRRRIHVAIVFGAEGKWTGLISMEDIIEEIIGTITDEFESEEIVQLAEVCNPRRVVLEVDGSGMIPGIRRMLAAVPAGELPQGHEAIANAVIERERLAATYLGRGIAMPHARLTGLARPVLIFGRSTKGIPMEASAERAHLIFLLLTPAGQPRVHQRLQARIVSMLENSEFVTDRLQEATTAEEIYDVIRTGEQAALD